MHVRLFIPFAAVTAVRLLTPLPSPPVTAAASLSAPTAPPSPAKPAPARAQTEPGTAPLEPNSAGLIDLAALLTAVQRASDQSLPLNPFRLRYHPPLAARTVTVAVGGVIRGADRSRDCCVLNDQVLRPGESFEGLILETIAADRIVLRSGSYFLALPASDRSLTLRLPS